MTLAGFPVETDSGYVEVYATTTGPGGPCGYTNIPDAGSVIYLVSQTESTCGPPSSLPSVGNAAGPVTTVVVGGVTTVDVPSQPTACQIT